MRDAIVFISRNRVLPGKLDGLRAFLDAGASMLGAAKPRTLAFLPDLPELPAGFLRLPGWTDADR